MNADATPSQERAANDPRPIVPVGKGGRLGVMAFGIFVLAGGAWIFSLMAQQREALESENAIGAVPDYSQRISSPPPLALPPGFGDETAYARAQLEPVSRTAPVAAYVPPVQSGAAAPSAPRTSPAVSVAPDSSIYRPSQPAVSYGHAPIPNIAPGAISESGDDEMRVKASRFKKPGLTVPQGTIIPAVLETALDSTRPGALRALVQRDIHAFDGSRVLIPRGSRLYGTYEAGLERGQNRALIEWTRLIRPDGVTIALNSPASDPLGRAGIKGKVDGKFLQRFGGAILESVLDIGVGVAAREASDGVIVALPGSTQNVSPARSQADVTPTLKVRHGTSVSVFVARDLDFSTVE